ncbi:MAG: class I SAM-dependent methyltransferase [Deltaproteobacteria bacterium]|nr:class I SAM-dependent methyltransferase [Deltaproteobacteria bacterium]
MENYYQTNFNEYHKRTFLVDSSSFLEPFVKVLPPGTSVLDVGCGSGRDILWLKNMGFKPTGFEQSPGLAALARKHTGCKVIEGDFETYNFSTFKFYAILASGSMVHVPHNRLRRVIQKIRPALDRNGIFYISLKQGENTKTDNLNRTFYLWQDNDLKQLFSDLNFELLHSSNTKSVLNSKDLWLGYVLMQTR